MWVAPSTWPCTHSSSSRTSRITASSGSSADRHGRNLLRHHAVHRGTARAERPRPARMAAMTAAPRSRARARLVAAPFGHRAVGHREPHQRADHRVLLVGRPAVLVPTDVGGPVPFLRWAVPVAAGARGAGRPSACSPWLSTGCTAGRSPGTPSTRAPAGSPRPGRWCPSPASRPSTSPAGSCSSSSGWPRSPSSPRPARARCGSGTCRAGVAQRVADDLAARAERIRDQAT